MTDTITPEARLYVARHAAKSINQGITQMAALGLPLDAILSGVLGECVRLFAQDQGWEEAAALCDDLSRQARTLAKPGAPALAAAQPAGRA